MELNVENKIKLCIICTSCCNDFKEIDNVTRHKFEILSPGVFIGKDAVICDDCLNKLKACCNFKSNCLSTENLISAAASDKDQMDIIDVFMNQVQNNNLKVSENDRICRLCMKMVKKWSWTYLTDEIQDLLGQYIPELNLCIIKDPVMCTLCNASVQNCLYVMGKIYGNCDINEPYTNNQLITEVKVKEEVIIKSEYNLDFDTKSHTSVNNNEAQPVSGDFKVVEFEAVDIKHEELVIKSERLISERDQRSAVYQCHNCQFVTFNKPTLKNHMISHQIVPKPMMYQCDKCLFQTRHKPALKRHSLLHQNSSDLTMYCCNNCGYETKYKHVLQVHMLVHQESSASNTYQCGTCQYQARCKRSLETHESIHKDAFTTAMFRCDSCAYLTKRRSLLNRHKRVHDDVTEAKTYKCTVCDCRVKYRHDLKKHMLLHADSKATMYKCEFCEHVTKYKSAIKEHMVVHQSEAEATMYPCGVCDFRTKHKKYLKRHAQTHNMS